MESRSDLLETVAAERESVDSDTQEQVVTLGVERAREGREGRKVGTIFTVGNAGAGRPQSLQEPLAPSLWS